MTNKQKSPHSKWSWLIFCSVFCLSLALGAAYGLANPASAAPAVAPNDQTTPFAGSSACSTCHGDIHESWTTTRHALAFSSPIFQRDWEELKNQSSCLECHTTGYDATNGGYAEEGVGCEACHGAFQTNHPAENMAITPDANLCSRCHKTTTDEWKASVHSQNNIQCQSCHNPHAQTPMADSITALCGNCHKERGESFTHGTHANAGLECSNCHMYTSPRMEDPIEGLVATGHTFAVGSEACTGCHQDTVHNRDEIIKLTGEIEEIGKVDTESLEKKINEQEQTIASLETSSEVRLYTGLIQGAIVGLVTGGVAAWVVSSRIAVVEVEEEDE